MNTIDTEADRRAIAKARELAALDGPGIRRYAGSDDPGYACAVAFGVAQEWLATLADALERLAGALERPRVPDDAARRLAEIREVLRGFDGEFHDRQLALEAIEAIERIAFGGEA